eukprot:COSAG04_NODE_3793_length_2526_cov_1.479604_1_plen_150_part_10
MTVWSSRTFHATSARGGAVLTSGPTTTTIRDTTFQTNTAPKGASLAVTAASGLRISNTTIDEPTDESSSAVWTVASTVATCAENPCEAGRKCTFKSFSTFCDACGENEIGMDGVECTTCPSGTQPEDSHSRCLPCEPGQYSQIGLCIPCA